MSDAGKYALCAFARNRNAEARQVALLPAHEELDAYGEQVPLLPVLHVLHIPGLSTGMPPTKAAS